jgi:hypothetical protein
MQARFSSCSFLLFLIKYILLKIQEELTTEVSEGYGFVVMQCEGFTTGKHQVLCNFNTERASSR